MYKTKQLKLGLWIFFIIRRRLPRTSCSVRLRPDHPPNKHLINQVSVSRASSSSTPLDHQKNIPQNLASRTSGRAVTDDLAICFLGRTPAPSAQKEKVSIFSHIGALVCSIKLMCGCGQVTPRKYSGVGYISC